MIFHTDVTQKRIERYMERMDEQERQPRLDAIVHTIENNHTRAQRAVLLTWLETAYPSIAAEVRRAMRPAVQCAITYTTAPAAYDGFGSEEIEVVGTYGSARPLPLRKVETPAEHVNWQRGRYGSGMYVALTEDEFAKEQGYGWFIPTVTD